MRIVFHAESDILKQSIAVRGMEPRSEHTGSLELVIDLMFPRYLSKMACLWLCVTSPALTAETSAAPGKLEFNRDIRPILSDKCYSCHGPDGAHRKGNLRLDTVEGSRAERDGVRAIVPGRPTESELARRITATDDSEKMPPPDSGKTLTAGEIETLQRWISQGAEYQSHWAYLPIQIPAIPAVADIEWPINPIDRFLLAKLEGKRIQPSTPAAPVTLVRRLYLDLTGLLPTVAEVAEYENDIAPDRFERAVDRLLNSPQYGEKMATYWLDLVRYANTVGYHGDQEHPITPYRDYVIEAFNSNMPFDEFTREQLAGDLLPGAGIRQKIASGYNRLLQTSHEGGVQVKEYLHKYDADRVRNLSSVWLGATLGCAECHNHKYDPFTQKAFYQFAAFFADVDDMRTFKGGDTNPTRREPEMLIYEPGDEELIKSLEQELQRQKVQDGASVGQSEKPAKSKNAKSTKVTESAAAGAIRAKLDSVRQRVRRTMVTESIKPKVIRVLHRGDWMDESGEIVEPAFPEFLEAQTITQDHRLNRLDLANWLTSPRNPLTARVFVNRLWYLYFGVGLSNSLEDLGSQGEWPTHPELLDWLAGEFIRSGWDVKHLVRMIVTSQAYRQASEMRPELRSADPENRLFARQSQFRMPAEMVRDNALLVSGLLVQHQRGISHPYQPVGYYQFLNFPKRDYKPDQDDNQYRRAVYIHWQRQYLHPMLNAFDASTREECTVRRPVSNTPLAALTMLNDPTFLESARLFALRTLREGGTTTRERLQWAWKTAVQRNPDEAELAALNDLLKNSLDAYAKDPKAAGELLSVGLRRTGDAGFSEPELAAWTSVARAILNLHEMITRN